MLRYLLNTSRNSGAQTLRTLATRRYAHMSESELLEKTLSSRYQNTTSSANETFVRCTILNKFGNLELVSRDIRRKELIEKFELMPRDIRKINHKQGFLVPQISVRDDSILINLLEIRALIKKDLVVIFEPTTYSPHHNMFLLDLQRKLKEREAEELPYEMRALESMFVSVGQTLRNEIKVRQNVVKSLLQDLENDINPENLRHLLGEKKQITTLCQRTKLIKEAIDDLLDQDDVLTQMYLTEPKKSSDDHTEIEILLETYYKHFDEALQIVEELANNIKTTQEIINIVLDSNRNQLMLLGVRFSIGLLFLGCSIYVSSIYGMNLFNFIEESDYGFLGVVGGTMLLSIAFFGKSLRVLHKLERVTMKE